MMSLIENSRHARIIKQFKCQTVFETSTVQLRENNNIERENEQEGSVRKSLIFMSKQYK